MMPRWLLALFMLLSPSVFAAIETYEFESDLLRERYQELSNELRCPKCQNQNIADSNAPIAEDLRRQLYQQLHAGKDDAEIVDFMVQRYGEFVLYRPRWGLDTALLWLAPLILLGLALLLFVTTVRRGRNDQAAGVELSVELSEADQARLESLLESNQNRD
jgi:cytochrome c-type biogenesis protein CcmH